MTSETEEPGWPETALAEELEGPTRGWTTSMAGRSSERSAAAAAALLVVVVVVAAAVVVEKT